MEVLTKVTLLASVLALASCTRAGFDSAPIHLDQSHPTDGYPRDLTDMSRELADVVGRDLVDTPDARDAPPPFCPGSTGLADSFDDSLIGAVWTWVDPRPDISIAEGVGRLDFVLGATVPAFTWATLGSRAYDVEQSHVTVEVAQVTSAYESGTFFRLGRKGAVLSDNLEMIVFQDKLRARWRLGGTITQVANVDYSASEHRFWRFRHAQGQVHFEVSADNISFVALGALTPPFSLRAVQIAVGAGAQQVVTNGGRATFLSVCQQ
jgi:hypothetical protein